MKRVAEKAEEKQELTEPCINQPNLFNTMTNSDLAYENAKEESTAEITKETLTKSKLEGKGSMVTLQNADVVVEQG